MRPSIRLLNLEVRTLQQGPGPHTLYICTNCRQEARPRPLAARQFLRHASSDQTPITERVRRKIWGTENPPGLKDPYGGKSVFEKKFGRGESGVEGGEDAAQEQVEGQQAQDQSEAQTVTETTSPAYEPATTWEGIERMGHLGRWSDLPPTEGDVYKPFMFKKRLNKKGHLELAAHQTAVELCLLRALNKPLTNACAVAEHDKSVFKMIWKCNITPGTNGSWDNVLVYPNKETETALVYIFEQIGGSSPEAVEATSDAGIESEETENAEEEFDPLEDQSDMVAAAEGGLPFFGYQEVRDRGFAALSLDDATSKFAFLKRFSQLSGHYFPDPTIHSVSSVSQVLDYLNTTLNPKPTKLAHQLAQNGGILDQANIKVFSKKQRPSNRDEELGRKKVIEKELRDRGLIE